MDRRLMRLCAVSMQVLEKLTVTLPRLCIMPFSLYAIEEHKKIFLDFISSFQFRY